MNGFETKKTQCADCVHAGFIIKKGDGAPEGRYNQGTCRWTPTDRPPWAWPAPKNFMSKDIWYRYAGEPMAKCPVREAKA